MNYRPYQEECKESIVNNYNLGFNSQLVVMATGLGKTRVMAGITDLQSKLGLFGKVFVLVNRVELAEQTREEFQEMNPELKVGIEQAENRADKDCHVVVGSVQTLGTAKFTESGDPIFNERIKQIDPNEFSVILVDETHRASAKTFRSVLMYFGVYQGRLNYRPWALLLGFTATPNRTDNQGLDEFYNTVACNYDIVWGIGNKWLTDIKAYRVSTTTNLDDFDLSSGQTEYGKDFSRKELEKAVNTPARNKLIIEKYKELHEGYRGIFFCVDVQHAKDLCATGNEMGITGKCVFGSTSKKNRTEILYEHRSGKFNALFGVNVFCLDSETEILTRSGWKGIDTISLDDLVANWDNWDIFFDKPKEIFHRNTHSGERMISIDSDVANMRITPDHNVVSIKHKGKTNKKRAADVIGKYLKVPAGGTAQPVIGLVPNPETRRQSQCPKQRLRCNRFFIKRETGMTEPDLTKEAMRRMSERDNMRYKNPEELTLDECWTIGFWIGDGTKSNLKSGGREYSLSQSFSNDWAFDFIREKLKSCGINYRETVIKTKAAHHSDYIKFSFSPGTGSGNQKVNGCYSIEPYLDKDGPDLLWGFNEQQFDCFIEGLWMADGDHGKNNKRDSQYIYSTNEKFLDKLQLIGTCRGFKTRKYWNKLYMKKSKNPQFGIGFASKYTLQEESESRPERVWCVKSTSGNIIARRKGKVFVTGNCEGYNDPGIGVACMCRPTQSRVFYTQAIGRALRPFPAPEAVAAMRAKGIEPEYIKPYAILIDFCDLSSKHNLVSIGSIFGMGAKYDCKGKSVEGEAKKVQQELSKLDEKQKAAVDAHKDEFADIAELRGIIERIDLLKVPEISQEIAAVSPLEWRKVNGLFEISLPGKDVIRIHESPLGYQVSRSINGIQSIVHESFKLENAVAYAERELIPDDAYDLLRAEASWKSKRPSEKQIDTLFGIRRDLKAKFSGNKELFTAYVKEHFSKGEVSNMISEAYATRR